MSYQPDEEPRSAEDIAEDRARGAVQDLLDAAHKYHASRRRAADKTALSEVACRFVIDAGVSVRFGRKAFDQRIRLVPRGEGVAARGPASVEAASVEASKRRASTSMPACVSASGEPPGTGAKATASDRGALPPLNGPGPERSPGTPGVPSSSSSPGAGVRPIAYAPIQRFRPAELGGTFDGVTVASDADPGL